MNSLEFMFIYGTVARITSKMVSAAENNNWVLLAQLEASCRTHIQSIQNNSSPVVLASKEREEKVRVITEILKNDRKIRDITQPGLAQPNKFM